MNSGTNIPMYDHNLTLLKNHQGIPRQSRCRHRQNERSSVSNATRSSRTRPHIQRHMGTPCLPKDCAMHTQIQLVHSASPYCLPPRDHRLHHRLMQLSPRYPSRTLAHARTHTHTHTHADMTSTSGPVFRPPPDYHPHQDALADQPAQGLPPAHPGIVLR